MRLFSTAALSLALAASAGLIVPAIAVAKDPPPAPAPAAAGGPKLTASANFGKAAKPVQDLLNANNFDGALAQMPTLEGVATTPDDHYFLGNFYLRAGIGKKDNAMQRKGIEAMLASGKVPQADVAKFNLAAGTLAVNMKDSEGARAHFAEALKAGAEPSETEAMLAESYFGPAYAQIQNNEMSPAGKQLAIEGLPHLRKAIDAQVAKGTPPPLTWYERGLQTAALAMSPDALDWAKLTLAQTDKPNDWRIGLRLLQEHYKDMPRGANIDLMRLMFDAKVLQSDYSYGEYVDALWKSGLPGEVKTVVDSGRSAGELQPTKFADVYKLATDAIPKDKAGLGASATSAAAAADGKPASRSADAYLSYGDNAKAAELYKLALTKGGVDANEVNTRLGIALARSGDAAGAKAAFGAVAHSGARGDIAQLWTLWLDRKGKPTAA